MFEFYGIFWLMRMFFFFCEIMLVKVELRSCWLDWKKLIFGVRCGSLKIFLNFLFVVVIMMIF